jgi:hypothetical protein
VNCLASASTFRPCPHKVDEVTGPMDAMRTPSRASRPVIASKFLTVEELLKVIQSGFLAPKKISCARAGARRH